MTEKELAVARATFVALLRSGGTLHTFSLAVLVSGALVASSGPSTIPAALVAASTLTALPALYYAVRVRLDAELLSRLEGLEDSLEAGVSVVRDGAPPGLATRVAPPDARDPLDAYRRSARLFYRQAGFTASQGALLVAALVGLSSP